MAAIAIQTVGAGGNGNVTFAASNASDTVALGSHRAGGYDLKPVLLIITNGDSGTHVVTVGANPPLSILAGDTAVIPIYREGIGDPTVAVASDVVTSQTVAAVLVDATA